MVITLYRNKMTENFYVYHKKYVRRKHCLVPERERNPIREFAMMMEAASTSETSVNFYQTIRRNNPEDSHLQKSVFP
jgi:hypothetical protein